jgi:hypothetical protein
MGKYRQVVAQWALIEGSMAEHYGLTAHDIFTMSWRRFRILYRHLFTIGLLVENPAVSDGQFPNPEEKVRFHPINDWNKLAGRTAPEKQSMISFDQYAKREGVGRVTHG